MGNSCSLCKEGHYANGLCRRHYYQEKRGKLENVQKRGQYKYNDDGKRWCNYHETYHEVNVFPKLSSSFDGLAGNCREGKRWKAIEDRYGVNEDWWWAKYIEQDGKCAMCNENEAELIDHDHSCCEGNRTCGKCLRDLLCRHCNATLGHLEKTGWLESALKYKQRHEA